MRAKRRNTARIAKLITRVVDHLELDLVGLQVLTEAATGPYIVTPVIAAFGGANVVALTKDSAYGSASEVIAETTELARILDVQGRIEIVENLSAKQISAADIVTNSGHIRPLGAQFVGQMMSGAVIPLMYESWEFREADVDLDACRKQGIMVAGTNEQHPNVRVFDYLGIAVIHGLVQCGVPAPLSRILLICDNAFAPYIAETLVNCGAELEILTNVILPPSLASLRRTARPVSTYDAMVVADPGPTTVIGESNDAKYRIDEVGRFDALVQIFGDVDRRCIGNAVCYPKSPPPRGHMGVNLSELGPDPIVRLQAAGLKVGEVLKSAGPVRSELLDYCQPLVPSPKAGHAFEKTGIT